MLNKTFYHSFLCIGLFSDPVHVFLVGSVADERVVRGHIIGRQDGVEERSPAHTIGGLHCRVVLFHNPLAHARVSQCGSL